MTAILSRSDIRNVRASLDTALEAVAKQHGLVLQLGTIRFSPDSFSVKLDGRLATAESAEVASFKAKAASLGIDQSALGQTYADGSMTYRVVGMPPRGRRVLVERIPDGKQFIAPSATVALRFPFGAPATSSPPSSLQAGVSTAGTALDRVLHQLNGRARLFDRPPVQRPRSLEECWPIFAELTAMLSPENLTADGERPRREVERLRSLYTRAWGELEAIAGVRVSETDVYARNGM